MKRKAQARQDVAKVFSVKLVCVCGGLTQGTGPLERMKVSLMAAQTNLHVKFMDRGKVKTPLSRDRR